MKYPQPLPPDVPTKEEAERIAKFINSKLTNKRVTSVSGMPVDENGNVAAQSWAARQGLEANFAAQSKEIGFLAKYVPNFYGSDEVARWDDLTRCLNYEMSAKEQAEKGLYDTHYHQAFFEYEEVQNKLFEKAFNAYTQGKQSLRLNEFIKNYIGSSNEDRKELGYLSDILSYNMFAMPTKYKDYSEVFRDYLKVTNKLFNAAMQEREKITAQKSKPSPILEQIMNATAGQQKQQPTEAHSLRERSQLKV